MDFLTFLREVGQVDVPRLSLAESQSRFSALIERRSYSTRLGPWEGREDALHAEMRAFILGRALPDTAECVEMQDGLIRLSDQAYRRARTRDLGRPAVDALLAAIVDIEVHNPRSRLETVYPELALAARATRLLQQGSIPEGLQHFDRIVVDEIQDLTMLELAVVVSLCLATGSVGKKRPKLFLAGDAGQTVRPSGYSSASVNQLLNNQQLRPNEFLLEGCLRTPAQITKVIERSGELYNCLPKKWRPDNQGKYQGRGPEYINASLIHVNIPDLGQAINLLEKLKAMEGVALVLPYNKVPNWMTESLQHFVLLPADTKGLEYPTVCLLCPGPLLQRLSAISNAQGYVDELEVQARRTEIDQLRVALSRATATLVFIDVEANEEVCRFSQDLLGDPEVYTSEDLMAHLKEETRMPEQRALERKTEALQLVDTLPQHAWQRIRQAVHILDDSDTATEVSDSSVRAEVDTALLTIASRLLLEKRSTIWQFNDLETLTERILQRMGTTTHIKAFRQLKAWTYQPDTPPFGLLNTILELGSNGEWIRSALPSVYQTMRRALNELTETPETAQEFFADVAGWLSLLEFPANIDETARKLRGQAFDTLLQCNRIREAETVLLSISPRDQVRMDRFLGLQQILEESMRALIKGAVFAVNGQSEKALALFDIVIEEKTVPNTILADALVCRGEVLGQLSRGEFSKALTDLDQAILLSPDHAYERSIRGDIFRRMGDYDKAIQECTKGIDLLTDRASVRVAAEFFLSCGSAHAVKLEYDHALRDFNHALHLHPEYAEAYFRRGDIYGQPSMKKFSQAVSDFNRAIELEPRKSEFYSIRSVAHRRRGEYSKANEDCNKALELAPDSAVAHNRRGVLYAHEGNYNNALEHYTRAIELFSKFPDAFQNRSNAYFGLGQMHKASSDSKKAEGLLPHKKIFTFQYLEDIRICRKVSEGKLQNRIYLPSCEIDDANYTN